MARPKTGRLLSKIVTFRMTLEERNLLNKYCKDRGIDRQDFIRQLILNIIKDV